MITRRGKWRPLQGAMWFLVVVAIISMLVTLHLGDRLTWFRPRSPVKLNELPRGRLKEENQQYFTTKIKHQQPANKSTDSRRKNDHQQYEDGSVADSIVFSENKFSLVSRSHKTNAFDGKRGFQNENNHKNVNNDYSDIRANRNAQINSVDMVTRIYNTHAKDIQSFISKVSEKSINTNSVKDFVHDQYSTPNQFHGSRQEDLEDGLHLHEPNNTCLQKLYDKLSQIENASFIAPSILVKGSLSSIKHHLPLVESAFHKVKVKVTYETTDDNSVTHVYDETAKRDKYGIIFCLNTPTSMTVDECFINALDSNFVKVNNIPQLTEVMSSPKLMCVVDGELHVNNTGQWYGNKVPCFLATSNHAQDEDDCDVLNGWWVVSRRNTGASGQYFPCSSGSLQFGNLTNGLDESTVVVPLPKNLLTLDGSSPLVCQVQILVTSLLPLRVYLHQAGVVWEGLQEFVHRKHQKNVSLLDLHQLINELDNESIPTMTMQRFENVTMQAIKIAEKHIVATTKASKLCQKCFQVLDAVLVFDADFHPILLQITSSQYSEHLSSLSEYLLEQNILEDLAAMLVSRETISYDILRALVHFGVKYYRDEKLCSKNGEFCLKENDISFLMDTRREKRASRNWSQIYPSSIVPCQNAKAFSTKLNFTNKLNQQDLMEEFTLLVEAYFLCPAYFLDKIKLLKSVPNIPVQTLSCDASGSFPKDSPEVTGVLNQVCSNDNSTMPYLTAIYSFPYIQLHPEFSPQHTEYRAYVDYDIILIQISGLPRHCKNVVRLEDKHDTSRWVNFSLGLGENTAHLLVVGIDQPEPYVHNVYKIIIHRRRSQIGLGKFDPAIRQYQACSLKQDCSLPIWPDESCGLQPVPSTFSWKDFMRHHLALPLCKASSMDGEWMVPCSECQNESSCHWSDAIWQPLGCREGKLGLDDLVHCLSGKKVLFIGDSTNRGILHYMLERLNGSLIQWDKTHNIRIYPDLNDNKTVFGFAYYPQFWLLSEQRPIFDKAFTELIKRTREWSEKETVIVLGGVHWLAKHHLEMLSEGLLREGLLKFKVIVKGLGAGFHQPVNDVHQLTLEDQQRLPMQNQAVLSHAMRLGFSVVDTFPMTMSRYKDFMQGKCACHFHKVSAVGSPVTSKFLWSSSSSQNSIPKYHVEGDINMVYSEMVINRICAKTEG